MNNSLRVLIVEDSEFDARILAGTLEQGGYKVEYHRVETAKAMQTALGDGRWDLILSDYNMPTFTAPGALLILKESGLDLPFIIISGGIGEGTAVAAMKAGADDYLMKGSLARLVPAVERELREAESRAARRQAEQALRESELRYRLLWETVTDAVILIDPDGTIQFANPAVETVFGYKPEEIVSQNLAVLQPEKLREANHQGLEHFLHTGEKRLNWRATETTGRRKDGTEISIEVAFSDMELQGKRQYVGLVRDITERKRAERALRENQEQFRVAREIQQRLFPKAAPIIPGFDIAGASYPADATGGDYFDYLPMLNHRLGMLVADVTGHGVGPALLMAETRAYLRVLARNREDVGEILTRANRVLSEDVDYERFVTLMLARLDPRTCSLVYASAGHPSGYVLDAGGNVKNTLKRTGLPLGVQPDTKYAGALPITLAPGDLVLFLTDGIEEAIAPDETFFGIERTLDVVRANREKSAREIVEALYQSVQRFSQNLPQLDDVTAIVVKVTSSS